MLRTLLARGAPLPAKAFQPSTLPRLARGLATAAEPYDLVVLGGGPGGYVAAIKAAQLGLRTACVEKRGSLGGTCLNVGCIPSKSLLNNSHHFYEAKHDYAKRGIIVEPKLDLDAMMKAKRGSVTGLTKGIEGLFKKNKVDYVKGFGTFSSPNSLDVKLLDGGETRLEAKNIVIATGSEVTPFPGIEIDEKQIVSSTGALELEKVPGKMIVIGGGIIGIEMGSVWSRLGAEVTVVEYMNAIGGAGMDGEVSSAYQKILKKQGLNFKLGTKVLGANKKDGKVVVEVEDAKGGKKEQLDADIVLVAIGRRPVTKGLNLEAVGVETDERGRVIVDDQYNTSCPGVRCIGDATFGPMLAHKAEDEGIAVANFLAGKHGHVNYNNIPSVLYGYPEVAWCGPTTEELEKKGIEYNVGKFPFLANSRAKTNDDAEGFVKFITEKSTDKILACHIIGPNAGEMITTAGLAIEYSASAEDVAAVCVAHPTLGEALRESAMAASFKKAIHF